eukprot:4078061-Prymnesium_polylepis.2
MWVPRFGDFLVCARSCAPSTCSPRPGERGTAVTGMTMSYDAGNRIGGPQGPPGDFSLPLAGASRPKRRTQGRPHVRFVPRLVGP